MRRFSTILTTTLLCAAICCTATSVAQRRTRSAAVTTPPQKTVYDTVRVVVTDTVVVRTRLTKPAKRLSINYTPRQIDSLVSEWKRRQNAEGYSKFYEQYIAAGNVDADTTPDSLYRQRLNALVSPIQLPYNNVVHNYIARYTSPRMSEVTKRILSLTQYYFPLIEDELLRADLPVELRALPIIESALSASATSRMGAAGLWQFMPSTAKNLGLEVNSLVDERCDVLKSTRAACKFLKQLYGIYGDWTLAIAAYNCGPGNVNKALARAGSSAKTFWDIYDYLPAETRGYVPAFIGASYAYAYHSKHNIAMPAPLLPVATDTVTVNRIMHLEQVSSTLGISLSTLRTLNPQYKLDIIPASTKPYALVLPTQYLTEYISKHDDIISKDSVYLKEYLNPHAVDRKRAETVGYVYTVKKGDNLGAIAKRNRCTVKELQKWNNLKTSNIRIGQRLRIDRPKPRK